MFRTIINLAPTPQARKIQKLVIKASTVDELFLIQRTHGHEFNEVICSTFIHRIAKLDKGTSAQDYRFHNFLKSCIITKDWGPREIANTLWALGKIRCTHPHIEPFLQYGKKIIKRTIQTSHSTRMQDKISSKNEFKKYDLMQPQEFANSCWALSRLKIKQSDDVLTDISLYLERDYNKFKPQELANIAWALAVVAPGQKSDHLCNFLQNVDFTQSGWNSQTLANVAWAVATVNGSSNILLSIAVVAESRLLEDRDTARGDYKEWTPQEVSNLLWAFATKIDGHIVPRSLFTAAAKKIIVLLPRCQAKDLANIAWSYARIRYYHVDLLTAIHETVLHSKVKLSKQDTANLMWAFAHLNFGTTAIMTELAATQNWENCHGVHASETLGSVLWSLGRHQVRDAPLLERIGKTLIAQPKSNTRALANMIWAWHIIDIPPNHIQENAMRRFLENPDSIIGMDWIGCYNACEDRNDPLCQQIENLMFQKVIDPFTKALLAVARAPSNNEDAWINLEATVSKLQISHVGHKYSKYVIEALGIQYTDDPTIAKYVINPGPPPATAFIECYLHAPSVGINHIFSSTTTSHTVSTPRRLSSDESRLAAIPSIPSHATLQASEVAVRDYFDHSSEGIKYQEISTSNRNVSQEDRDHIDAIDNNSQIVPDRFQSQCQPEPQIPDLPTSSIPRYSGSNPNPGQLRSLFSVISREDHAELHALSVLCSRLNERTDVHSDIVTLFVGHWCCVSCLAVLAQVRSRFPNIQLKVGWHNAWKNNKNNCC